MIGVSEIAVAVVTSLVIAVVVVLAAAIAMKVARLSVRSVRHSALWTAVGDDNAPAVGWDRGRTLALVGVLVLAAVAGTAGTFVPLYRDFPRRGSSISLYNTMHYAAITTYLDFALLLALAGLVFRRRDRVTAALIVGYCATAVGSFAVFATSFTSAHAHVGAGYYLLGVGEAAECAAAALSIGAVMTGPADRKHRSARCVWCGITAAALVSGASTMLSSKPSGLPLWLFSSVSRQGAAALLVGLVALAVVPLLALRLADRSAGFMALGLAIALALETAAAGLDKLSEPRFTQITVAFWLTALAAITLVAFAVNLAHPAQHVTAGPTPVGVT